MFYKSEPSGYKQVLDGIKIKTLVYGEKTLLTEFHLEGGKKLPRHVHTQEQIGYLVKGYTRLTIGKEVFEVLPGNSWCIPANVEHEAEIVIDSVAIEVFSPVREDYLPENLKELKKWN